MKCKHHDHEMSWCLICYCESVGLDYYKLKDDYIKSGESDYFMRKFQEKKKNGDYDLEDLEK